MKVWKNLVVLIFIGITSSLVVTACSDSSDASDSSSEHSKFVGTFYSDAASVVSYHADGTVVHVRSLMFNEDPNINAGRRRTPGLGTWRQTGDNEIEIKWIGFLTEPNGGNFDPNGLTWKVSYTAVFDEPVEGKSRRYTVDSILTEYWLPGQNPVTEDPAFMVLLDDKPGIGYRLE